MIEKFTEKMKNGQVSLEFAESGAIAILERRYDEVTGIPMLKATQETNSQHITDLIRINEEAIAPFEQRRADLAALAAAVAEKEAERENLKQENDKRK